MFRTVVRGHYFSENGEEEIVDLLRELKSVEEGPCVECGKESTGVLFSFDTGTGRALAFPVDDCISEKLPDMVEKKAVHEVVQSLDHSKAMIFRVKPGPVLRLIGSPPVYIEDIFKDFPVTIDGPIVEILPPAVLFEFMDNTIVFSKELKEALLIEKKMWVDRVCLRFSTEFADIEHVEKALFEGTGHIKHWAREIICWRGLDLYYDTLRRREQAAGMALREVLGMISDGEPPVPSLVH